MKWVQDSFQGKDGKASSRKLTTFAGMIMLGVTWFCDLFYNLTIDQILLVGLICIVLIGAGLMTAQNIVDIMKRPTNSYYDNDIYNPMGRKAGDEIESIDEP